LFEVAVTENIDEGWGIMSSRPGLCRHISAGATPTPETQASWQLNAVNEPASAANANGPGPTTGHPCRLKCEHRQLFVVTAVAGTASSGLSLSTGELE
jgi:hypothetical protein